PLLLVQPLHALDGQPLVVQQPPHRLQQDDVLRPVEASPARALQRRDEAELRLPEAQHVLGGADLLGRLGNGPEGVGALGHGQAGTMASWTRPFMICEARKLITRRGWIAAGSPVLGLRPMRARFSRTWKTPKPESFTVSPRSRDSTMSSSVRSTSSEHSCRDSPTSS